MESPADAGFAQQDSFSYTRKMEPSYLVLGSSTSPAVWLDVRVFYVRVSCCSLDEAPESLTIRYVPRTVGTSFEVNGSRISPAEEAVRILRRDRVDKESAEATYVSTDRLRTTGTLPFEVCDRKETLICGSLNKSDVWSDGQGFDRVGHMGTLTKGRKPGWFMECKCVCSPRCALLKGRGDFLNSGSLSPLMEVYVAGQYSVSPVILTQTVQLVAKRKICRRGTLDVIPEADESERASNNEALADIASQMEEDTFYQEVDKRPSGALGMYESGSYMEGDDGEITWFNAGVRVGVGIGLGMCVGIGIGVGLLMRTYQATTRTFRRRFL